MAVTQKKSEKEDTKKIYPILVDRKLIFKDFEIDLRKGYSYQIFGKTKEQYQEILNSPVTFPFYVPLFDGAFFDFFSTTEWYVIPLLWVPIIVYHIIQGIFYHKEDRFSMDKYVNYDLESFSAMACVLIVIFGIFVFSLCEYLLHRFIFHAERWLPDSDFCRYISLFIHGFHHAFPLDP